MGKGRRIASEARLSVLRFGCLLVMMAGDSQVLEIRKKSVSMHLQWFGFTSLPERTMYDWLEKLEAEGLVERLPGGRFRLEKQKIFDEFEAAEAAVKGAKSGVVEKPEVDAVDDFGEVGLPEVEEEVVSLKGELCSNGDHYRISGRSRIQGKPCRRKATGLFNGRPFCARHLPEKKEAAAALS